MVMFFVNFVLNRSALLINPGVLCEGIGFDFVRKKLEKEGV